jgi:hypothetical protein
MTSRHNINETAATDIQFVLSECARLHEITSRMTPQEFLKVLSNPDFDASLPLPNGHKLRCGVEALRRLYRLATNALRESDAAGTVEPEKVSRALNRLFVQRFIEEQQPPDVARVEMVLAAAVEEAKRTRSDATHFVPCRLMMFAKDPTSFSVGPVTFRACESFHELMGPRYAAYVESSDLPQQRELCGQLLTQARHYYDGFGWVGEVRILSCDPETSKKRALLAATAALDILHLLFGAYHTNRMMVGGPRLADDRRAHLHLDDGGPLHVTCSSSSTSAVGFRDGWDKIFERDDFAFLLCAASKAIEPLVNASVQRPLGIRFIDAAAWFGDAVREQSDAARVVKASNALEHLLTTGERHGITKRLSHRVAAVCYDPDAEESFDDIAQQFVDAYELRSDLVHGSLSPFDPGVEERCWLSMRLTERALCSALGFFEHQGLLDRSLTNEELAAEFGALISWAKNIDAARKERRLQKTQHAQEATPEEARVTTGGPESNDS